MDLTSKFCYFFPHLFDQNYFFTKDFSVVEQVLDKMSQVVMRLGRTCSEHSKETKQTTRSVLLCIQKEVQQSLLMESSEFLVPESWFELV